MILGVTEIPEYKLCRRRWFIGSRNRLGLTPIVPPTALSLGTFVHAALGGWIADPSASPKMLFMQAAQVAVQKAIETYRIQVGAPISDSEIRAMEDAVAQGYSMMENYELHWKKPLPDEFTVVGTEQRIKVRIPGTLHDTEWVWDAEKQEAVRVVLPEPDYHYLQGRIDGLIQDKRGRLYILEHKTYGSRPRPDTLARNDQFLAYTYMVRQADFGFPVAGIAYDGLWKRAAPPKTVDGRKGTLADLFIRKRLERSQEELDEFESELAALSLEVGANPPIFKNRRSDGSCEWGCSYVKLCDAMSLGEDVDYVKKRNYTKKEEDVLEEDKEVETT